MSYSCTPPCSLEWKPESRPSYARMPGLSLHKNLNKLQGPAGKQAAQHTLMKHSCRKLLCRPFLSWIGSKLWLKSPWRRATRVIWERVIETFSSFFFFQKGLYHLCRRLLARAPGSQGQGTRAGLGKLTWAWAQGRRGTNSESLLCLLLSPSVSSLQKPPAAKASCKHPCSDVNIPTLKPSVSESNLPSAKIKFPLSSMSPDLFLLSLFESESRSVISDSLQPHGLYIILEILQAKILEWVSCSLFQGIFPTQ